MQGHYHAVVWIDHRQARVFHFNTDDADKIVVHAEHPVREFKRGDKRTGHRLAEDQDFLEDVDQGGRRRRRRFSSSARRTRSTNSSSISSASIRR